MHHHCSSSRSPCGSPHTLLHIACHKAQLGLVKVILYFIKETPNWPNEQGATPLHVACSPSLKGYYEKREIVKLLLISPPYQHSSSVDTAAFVNAQDKKGQVCASLLLRALCKTCLNHSINQQTALHIALRSGVPESIFVLLLAAGANYLLADGKGRLPIQMTNDAQVQSRFISAIQTTSKRCEDTEIKLRMMYTHIALASTKVDQPRCPTCHRDTVRCVKLQNDQYVRWLYVHNRVPH